MNPNVQGFWYGVIRRMGRNPPLPPLDVEDAHAEYVGAPDMGAPLEDDACAEQLEPWSDAGEGAGSRGERFGRAPSDEAQFVELYAGLRGLAERFMRGQRKDHSLEATALLHEAYLRVVKTENFKSGDRSHRLRLCSRAMRCVLI